MLSLLFIMVLFEMGVTIALLFQSPLRWLLVVSLDQLKRGRGMVVATTVVIVMAVIFCASVNHVMNLDKVEMLNPTLGVLEEYRLLETTLLGIYLLLFKGLECWFL